MTKKEHIQYWITTADKDWEVVNTLFDARKYLHCLYFSHLVIEKLCKALWVKNNENNYPPKIHNLLIILDTANVVLTKEQKNFLAVFNDFQLESRYPDYTQKIYKICTLDYTNDMLNKVKDIKICLLSKLQ